MSSIIQLYPTKERFSASRIRIWTSCEWKNFSPAGQTGTALLSQLLYRGKNPMTPEELQKSIAKTKFEERLQDFVERLMRDLKLDKMALR